MIQNNLEILQEVFPSVLYPHENGQIYNCEGIPITKEELINNIKYMADRVIESNKEFIDRMSEPMKISPYFTSNWVSVSSSKEAINNKLSTQWDKYFKFIDIYPYATSPKVLHHISTGQGISCYVIMDERNVNFILDWYIDIINKTIPELPEPSFYILFNNSRAKYWKVSCCTGAILETHSEDLDYVINNIPDKTHDKSGYNLSIKRFLKECKIEPNTVWSWSEKSSWFMHPNGGFDGCSDDSFSLSYMGTTNI